MFLVCTFVMVGKTIHLYSQNRVLRNPIINKEIQM